MSNLQNNAGKEAKKMTKEEAHIASLFPLSASCSPKVKPLYREFAVKVARGEEITDEEIELVEKSFPLLRNFNAYYGGLGISPQAYWLGVGLTMLEEEDLEKLWEVLPEANEKRKYAPKKLIPLHLWQVLITALMLNKGKVDPRPINLCMIRWAEVLEVHETTLKVRVACVDKNLRIVYKTGKVIIDKEVVPGVIEEDFVAIHYTHAVMKITEKQKEALRFWTNKVLEIFREFREFLEI